MLFVILYIDPTSHQIECSFCGTNIKVYHSAQVKMHQLLFSPKDKTNNVSKPGVYRIPCECTLVKQVETWPQKKRTSGLLQKRSSREIFGDQTCVRERTQIPIERLHYRCSSQQLCNNPTRTKATQWHLVYNVSSVNLIICLEHMEIV